MDKRIGKGVQRILFINGLVGECNETLLWNDSYASVSNNLKSLTELFQVMAHNFRLLTY
jgi:hypothetical protein